MARLDFQLLLLTAAHARCLRIALGAKLWFLSPMKISPSPSFGMVDALLGPLGFMGSVPVFLHLEGQMRGESPMRTFISGLCFPKPTLFPLGSERREGRKLDQITAVSFACGTFPKLRS